MVGWSVKALKRCTQVTTGKAKASFFPNRRGNQVRSREKIPVFGEQDDWTRLYDFIQPLVLQMESHTRREWKRYWIVKKGKLCFKKKKKKKCSWVLNCTGRVFLGRRERGKKKRNEYKKKKITLAGMKKKKRHYNGLAAAFISIHACHNMYIFASDGNPSITRGLSDHDGVTTVVGGAGKKPVWCSQWLTTAIKVWKKKKPALHPFLSSSDPPAEVVQGKKKKTHEENIKCI